jgi:hypothetical protein
MSLATAELPTDPAALRAFALACQDELKAAELAVQYKTLEIEKLKVSAHLPLISDWKGLAGRGY